jgi:hypothetical protein
VEDLADDIAYNHAPETYVAWLKTLTAAELAGRQVTGTVAHVACPVDIEVFDSMGNLVGQTRNEIVKKTTPDQADVFVIADEKFGYMPQKGNYNINILGFGYGTMEYSASTVDKATGATVEQKLFANVAIDEGKIFSTQIGANIAISEVQLSVTDSDGKPTAIVNPNGTETAIKQDDAEQCFNLWGKETKWKKTPLNWFLLIVCFGWIWMAF